MMPTLKVAWMRIDVVPACAKNASGYGRRFRLCFYTWSNPQK